MIPIHGKHCIITGGSRGIGLAIAKLFASHGARCTLVALHTETLVKAVDSLPPISQASHNYQAFNVSDPHGWRGMVRDLKLVRHEIAV